MEETPQQNEQTFRSGYAAVIGRPSVGKSTLMNQILGQKIAAVSPRPQTTRRRQLGILTTDKYQVVFMDTPGLHKPVHKLGEYLNDVAMMALDDADVILWLVAVAEAPTAEDRLIAEKLAERQKLPPVILVLNKVDLLPAEKLAARVKEYSALYPAAQLVLPVSASSNKGVHELLEALTARIPLGLPYYEEDQVTDLYERDIAQDLIREAALRNLFDEVPHSIAVRLDEYTEQENNVAYIAATLFVERESQKGIVIGKGGEMMKKIGAAARKEIEALTERRVFLELRVKVNAGWRDNPAALRQYGYYIDPKED